MMKVAVLDDYHGVALDMADWGLLPREAEVQVFQDHLYDPDALVERLSEFHVVAAMRERTAFPREVLERLPKLELLVTTGMANASIDIQAATSRGIVVCGTGGLSNTIELTWALILALVRNIPKEDAETRRGKWQTTLGVGLPGKVLGLLGLGRLGSQVATIGAAFGLELIAWSQNLTQQRAAEFGAKLVAKDELFAHSDILSVHLRLSDRTRGLVGSRELGLMKPTAYLVNTSRGPIVDEVALLDTLHRGAIAGAGLDVFDQEPLPSGHPFTQMENTVLTPHLGYVTREGYRVFYEQTVEDIAAYLRGEQVRVLNPEAAKHSRNRLS